MQLDGHVSLACCIWPTLVIIHFTHVTPLNPECINCLSLWIKLSIA